MAKVIRKQPARNNYMSEYMRDYRGKRRKQYKDYERIRRYKITPELFEKLKQDQNNVCYICKAADRKLNIDHDHNCCSRRYTCGECVRGFICSSCNMKIGWVENLGFSFLKKYLKRRLVNGEWS